MQNSSVKKEGFKWKSEICDEKGNIDKSPDSFLTPFNIITGSVWLALACSFQTQEPSSMKKENEDTYQLKPQKHCKEFIKRQF